MVRNIAWYVYMTVSVVIGLGAFGHGLSARKVHEAIDQFPINPVVYQTLFIVWYSVSGSMFLYGALLLWLGFRLKAGDTSSLYVAYLIAVFHLVLGTSAIIYRRGDPFWALFIVLGVLLLGTSLALRPAPVQ